MAGFPIQEAQLVSLFMQSVAYGIHVVTFLMCLWTLLHPSSSSSPRKPINWLWLSVAIILFIIGTADVCFNLYHNLIAFVFYTGSGGAAQQFEDLSNWVNVMRTVWILLQAMISDAALLYRCWAIYAHRWIVILVPSILWLAANVCGAFEAYYTATSEDTSTIPDSNKLIPFIAAYCTLTLATNVLCTGLIAFRIWSIDKHSTRYFGQDSRSSIRIKLKDVNRIMIESALLYTSAIFITFIVELAGSNAEYDVSDVGIELAGIAFDLIIIRIGKGVAVGQVQTASDVPASPITLRAIRSTTADRATNASETEVDVKQGSRCDIEAGSWRKTREFAYKTDEEAVQSDM